MLTLLDARRVTRRYGARTLLERIDLHVAVGSRIALVGPNGSGKSTLLRILAGVEVPDEGVVARHGTVGYLPQVAAASGSLTVRQLMLERIGVAQASREVDRLARELDDGDMDAIAGHADALERWVSLGGEDAESRIAQAAATLSLGEELLERPLASLSGGQAARVGLAALEAARFDVVLLDEPTNHLDADGLGRLLEAVSERRGAVVMVSHDRAFLEGAADEVLALGLDDGRGTSYRGGWEAYEREREAARLAALEEYGSAVAERARVMAAASEHRRRAAVSASHAGSAARDGDKHAKEWIRSRAEGMQRRSARIEHRAEMIEIPDKPRDDPRLTLTLTAAERRGGAVLALRGAIVERGEWRLGPLDLDLMRGDRLLLAGPNGSGKSTLLAVILGRLDLSGGSRQAARGAVFGTLGQDRDALAGAETLASGFRSLTGLDEARARTALASFGLGADHAERSPSTLSPGELTRAELAAIAQRRTTCLLLDEPTNHLDVESLEVVEAALAGWPGALVVATHDLRLRESLALGRELRLPLGQ